MVPRRHILFIYSIPSFLEKRGDEKEKVWLVGGVAGWLLELEDVVE